MALCRERFARRPKHDDAGRLQGLTVEPVAKGAQGSNRLYLGAGTPDGVGRRFEVDRVRRAHCLGDANFDSRGSLAGHELDEDPGSICRPANAGADFLAANDRG
jgi:hypothetical protein